MEQRYKLTEAARRLGMSPWTLRRWVYRGLAPRLKSSTGRLFIPAWWVVEQTGAAPPSTSVRCVIYARESSSENQSALQAQSDRLKRYAEAKGYQVVSIVTEFASGVSDERKKLHALLKRRDFDVLLVEHKDRLTRLGFRWFEPLCPFKIEVVHGADHRGDDLLEDLVSIMTSFCTRLYGQRRGSKKTAAAIKALKEG